MEYRTHTSSPEETLELGRRIGRALRGRDVIFLDAPMGAGKTVLAKGIWLGIGGENAGEVLSPSYTLMNLYEGARFPCYHVDLYRLEDERQLLGMEYEDFLYENPGVTIVEWPRTAPELLAADEYLTIVMEVVSESERAITLSASGAKWQGVLEGAAC